MKNHASQKRQGTFSDADDVSRTDSCPKRLQLPSALPTIYVEDATATGSGRILNGIVHGDNIHGNSSTIINHFHGRTHGDSELVPDLKSSGTLSKAEAEEKEAKAKLRRKDLLQRLRFPQLDARLANLRKAQSHTCNWIREREDYKKWLDSNDLQGSDGFFWIKGNPGTGKSILMKFLYQTMQRQLRQTKTKDKFVISFFFNARGNELERSTLGLYRSLLFNLLNLEPELQVALDHCQISGYLNILDSGWQLQMLKEVFEEAIAILRAQRKQLYCFVDALDECPEDDVQDMVSYFEELVSSTNSQHFRVCFSSRHYPQITMRTRLTITLEEEPKHKEDIGIFLESQLLFGENPAADILQEIKAEILEKSSGIFLWVTLVVHQLNEVHRQDGRIRVVQQRLRNIPGAVMKRPAPNEAMPLYGLFEDIIQKDEKRIDELIRITQIVFCARQPMHPKELYVLLHQEFNGPFDFSEISDVFLTKHVLEVSKGLAEVTKSSDPTVQFIHETVREFLRDGGLENISTQSIDRTGHELMVASCLKQIYAPLSEHFELFDIYRCYRRTAVHGITDERQKKFQKQANGEFPFLEYATRNVFFHAEELEAMKVSQSQFLESFPLDEWIPIYNFFEEFNNRRYESNTPILYILAGNGCHHLIKSSARFSGQYAQEIKGTEFSSALANAIFNNHLDTAWTLVGLDARNRPRDINATIPERGWPEPPLIPMLLEIGHVQLMRRVLEDRNAMRISVPGNIDFSLVKSAEMIDMFLEVSEVPGFPSVGYHQQHPQADREILKPSRSNADLTFIRKAIETEPSLLESKAWGGETMCDYAILKGFRSLVFLFLEYAGSGQFEVDHVLHRAVKIGNLEMVKLATRLNASLASQDKNGNTALHLAVTSFLSEYQRVVIIQYLLSEDPSCFTVGDLSGLTPLHYVLSWPERSPEYPKLRRLKRIILKTFFEAKANVNAVFKCFKCPISEGHEVPLATFLLLSGQIGLFKELASNDRCDLNGRDNFGRTALSWCFAHRHGNIVLSDSDGNSWQGPAGKFLLQDQAVDVNSRDDSGYTILEHFIRYPFCNMRSPVFIFFQSQRLDSNLQTSNGQHPLELIVSLYNTWPIEFGEIDPKRNGLRVLGRKKPTGERRIQMRQQEFNKHLIQTTNLLLGTGKVEIEVRRRCADQATSELREVILGSMQVSC